MFNKLKLIGELGQFLLASKKWWLVPVMLILFLVGILIFLSQSAVLAPFIYTVF